MIDPGRRQSLAGQPTITVASDLHNNTFALGVLERATGDGPLFFVGDLTDRGSPLETQPRPPASRTSATRSCSSPATTTPTTSRSELAKEGAIVLTRTRPAEGGRHATGRSSTRSRACAWRATTTRSSARAPTRSPTASTTPRNRACRTTFLQWLRPLIGKVDVVMVHEPGLITTALQVLEDDPPQSPLVFFVGHTHKTGLEKAPGRDRAQRRQHRRRRHGQPDREHGPQPRALRVHDSSPRSSRSRPTSCRSTPARATPPRAARSWSRITTR